MALRTPSGRQATGPAIKVTVATWVVPDESTQAIVTRSPGE